MNRVFFFLVAIILVLGIELIHWEAFPNASQDLSDNFTTDAVAASNNYVLDSNYELGFDPGSRFKNSGATFSKKNASALDPVTMLLFGSGLVGLAGLGRKKIKK